MLVRFRAVLNKLVSFRHLFLLTGGTSLVGVVYIIFSGFKELDKYVLGLSMLFTWSLSLFCVLSGYLYLHFESEKKGFWKRIGYWLRAKTVVLFEVCFLATSAILIWLSVRSVVYILTH